MTARWNALRRNAPFIAGGVILAVAMGVGRFAYTPILVAMRRDAGLTVAMAGILASVNLAGYLIGALLALHSTIRAHAIAAMRAAVAAVILTTGAMALGSSLWIPLRFLTGVASGIAFVVVVSTLLDYASTKRSRYGVATLFAGVGIGIAASGLIVPVLAGVGGSRLSWLGLAAVSLVVAVAAVPALRIDAPRRAIHAPTIRDAPRRDGLFGSLLVIYGIEGACYIVPATFLVAMVNETPAVRHYAGGAWVLVGLVAFPSAPIWTAVANRVGNGWALVAAMVVQSLGMAAPMALPGALGVVVAAATLGATFIGVTLTGNAMGRELRPRDTGSAIAFLTVIYGIGQIIGPLVATRVSMITGHYRDALLVSAVCAMIGTIAFASFLWRINNASRETGTPNNR